MLDYMALTFLAGIVYMVLFQFRFLIPFGSTTIMLIVVGLIIFFGPIVEGWLRRRQTTAFLFSDEGVCRNTGPDTWSDMLRYDQVKAFHFERHRGGVWRVIIIRQLAELSHATWMDGLMTIDDDEAAAIEKDLRSRIKSAQERAA